MIYSMDPMELKEAILNVKRKGDKQSVVHFFKVLSSFVPPGEDYAVSVGAVGGYEYMVDRGGVILMSVTQDEYLPFFSARPKRVGFEDMPERIYKDAQRNLKTILEQFRNLMLEYRRRADRKTLPEIDEVLGVLVEDI